MKKPYAILIACFLITISSCKPLVNKPNEDWKDLPEVTNIDKLKTTEFVPTLESSISNSNNIIYASALLYAWDKVKQKINSPIHLTIANSLDFKILNQSTSFQNTLNDNEYSAGAEMIDSIITAKAFFHKDLPFTSKLQKLDTSIQFANTKVTAFGMQSFDEEVVKFTSILYYKNDDNFILKLTPKDSLHEIRLIKGMGNVTNLLEALKRTDSLVKLGNREKNNPKVSWKYILNETDIFSIPVIKFNIEKNYETIEGQVFEAKGRNQYIGGAYQRTGFILNENGAIVESEAIMSTDTSAIEPVKTHPKRMIFDKPFFIIVKRANSDNPYFMMKVENSELLIKE